MSKEPIYEALEERIKELEKENDTLKGMEKDLEAVHKRLTSHLENTPLGVLEWDHEFRLSAWSPVAEDIFGWSAHEVIGKTLEDLRFIHEDDRESVNDAMARLFARKEPHNIVHNRNYCKDGSVVHCEWYNSVLYDQSGAMGSIMSLVQNITKRKQAQEEVIKEKAFSDTIINSIPGAFFVRDEAGKLIRWSKKNEDLSGYSGSELSKMEPTALVVGEEKEFMAEKIREAFTTGETAGEVNFIVKGGKKTAAYFTALRMTIDEKRYLVGTAIDITELKEAQEALQRAHDELEEKVAERTEELSQANLRLQELDRLKSMFLASMSHELRTPLNSIIGFVSWLLMGMEGDLNEEQDKQLTMVKNSAEHLLSLINDILDISKIESGKVDLSIEVFDVAEVAKEVAETVLPQTKEKGLALTVDVPEGIKLQSDKRRVKQVFMNLVSNAIKFTDEGSVTVTGKLADKSYLEVTVRDSGNGIREEDMEKLFQPFQQIDMSSTKKHEGTGLGLYLCKKLMSFLHGTILARSRFGEGSAFTFTLPLEWHEEG
jgi:PAS domain S-box-containing protein